MARTPYPARSGAIVKSAVESAKGYGLQRPKLEGGVMEDDDAREKAEYEAWEKMELEAFEKWHEMLLASDWAKIRHKEWEWQAWMARAKGGRS